MEFPPSKAKELTEQIMRPLSKTMSALNGKESLSDLETSQYNRMYEHVYKILRAEFGDGSHEIVGFGLEDLKRGVGILDKYHQDGKMVVVVGSPGDYAEAIPVANLILAEGINGSIILAETPPEPKLEDLALAIKARPSFEAPYIPKQKRTNHERQPSGFGRRKNKRRKR